MKRGEVHQYHSNGYVVLHGGRGGQALVTHFEYCNGGTLLEHDGEYKMTYWIPGWNENALGAPSLIVRQRKDLTKKLRDDIKEAMKENVIEEPLDALYGDGWQEKEYHVEVIEIAQNICECFQYSTE